MVSFSFWRKQLLGSLTRVSASTSVFCLHFCGLGGWRETVPTLLQATAFALHFLENSLATQPPA